ncbi:MAG: NnrU family protein [Betaproteobacteria bacterium]
MNPMTRLLLAAGAFLIAHYVSSTPLRARLVRLLGANGYVLLYSAVAFTALGGMAWAYYRAPFLGLWHVPALRYAPLVTMPLALILVVCGVLMRNPTAVGFEKLLRGGDAARGVLRITRHPVMWGIALWAGSHIAARGDAAAALFFGSMLVLALSGTVLIDRRKGAALGEHWLRFSSATSNVPFLAILSGRNRLSLAEIGWSRPLLAILLYCVTLWLHAPVFGAPPY